MDNAARLAGVVELVDAPDSKSGARNGVRVRVPPPAPLSAAASQGNRALLVTQSSPLLSPGSRLIKVSGDTAPFYDQYRLAVSTEQI
jgi:hypothetical protein